jgi:hypothetical protein
MIRLRHVIVPLLLALAACQSPPGQAPTPRIGAEGTVPGDARPDPRKVVEPTVKPEPIQTEPLRFDDIIHKDDRIAFVGDDITQQQFYVRSFATALLCMKPDYGLRFFNGGIDGATAAAAIDWIDDFLATSKPTLVFICLGLNDGKNLPPSDAVIEKYEASMLSLIEKIKKSPGVREVVVMSSPAVQTASVEQGNKNGYNLTLYRMALSAQTIASLKKAKFVDLYEPMRVVYVEAARAGGDMLSIGGRLPTEDAHTVLASVMLYGIGVTREMLEPVGWAPLKPTRMGRVRGALGIPLREPEYRDAVQSRQIYEKMREFDALFFQAWRLAKPDRKTRSRAELLEQADAAWFELDTYVKGAYAGR